MTSASRILTIAAGAAGLVCTGPATAQYAPPFPPGAMEPAASQASVVNLNNRIVALEQQIAQYLRQAEENGFKIRQLEADLARLRDQDERIRQLEQKIATLSSGSPAAIDQAPRSAGPASSSPPPRSPAPAAPASTANGGAPDAAEDAYDLGYRLWRDGKYDQAITALRAMASSFPGHRRVSWANNLAGRAMLDKGEPRAAAEALLANYRSNPKGERAADSLFYLGQSLHKLGQPAQACKAYAELEAVYGTAMRAELQRLLPPAKAESNCS